MSINRKIIIITGIVLIITGMTLTLVGILHLLEGKSKNPLVADLFLIVVFGLGSVVAGGGICIEMRRKVAKDIEQQILKIAHDNNGILNTQEVALKTSLSLVEAKNILEEYFKKGFTQINMTEDGTVTYHFTGLSSAKVKMTTAVPTEDEDAVKEASVSLENNPNEINEMRKRANSYREGGKLDEALAYYNRLLELDGKNSDDWFYRGTILKDQGNHDSALADFDKAMELNPRDMWVAYNRGLIYTEKKLYDRAIADFDKAISLDPTVVHFFINRGLVYYNNDNIEKASLDFSKAIEVDPENSNAWFLRGRAKKDGYAYVDAINDFDQAIKLENDSMWSYYLRGYCHDQLKNFDNAIADWEKALELGVESNEIKKTLDNIREGIKRLKSRRDFHTKRAKKNEQDTP